MEQEIVQRGIWQHKAYIPVAGRQSMVQGKVLPLPEKYNRSPDRDEHRFFICRDMTKLFYRPDVGRHQSKGLVVFSLPLPQSADSLTVGRVAGDMKSAEALDRNDQPLFEQIYRLCNGISRDRPATVFHDQRHVGAALGARIRLGMEPPVTDIFEFLPAICAQFEILHGCPGTVIWQVFDDSEPWSAVGAVHKGIVLPVAFQFGTTIPKLGKRPGPAIEQII